MCKAFLRRVAREAQADSRDRGRGHVVLGRCVRWRRRRRRQEGGADGYAGQTLTVWVMDGSSPDQWQKDLAAEFEKKTKAKVKFEVQQWNGIQQKLTTALSEENPPDVFEIGNTQTPAYAKTGGLADLADLKEEIGADWTESLNESSVYEGKQYAAPGTSPTASSSTTRRSGPTPASRTPPRPATSSTPR